uniref:Uncharacterized protein n=1 Tax=Arundo donax TaxID=35708 RepID=A0A0A8ZZ74_ARUDO
MIYKHITKEYRSLLNFYTKCNKASFFIFLEVPRNPVL